MTKVKLKDATKELATGAGAMGRQVMGTTVIGGMLAATLSVFLVPALFVLVERLAVRP